MLRGEGDDSREGSVFSRLSFVSCSARFAPDRVSTAAVRLVEGGGGGGGGDRCGAFVSDTWRSVFSAAKRLTPEADRGSGK